MANPTAAAAATASAQPKEAVTLQPSRNKQLHVFCTQFERQQTRRLVLNIQMIQDRRRRDKEIASQVNSTIGDFATTAREQNKKHFVRWEEGTGPGRADSRPDWYPDRSQEQSSDRSPERSPYRTEQRTRQSSPVRCPRPPPLAEEPCER